MKIIKLGVLILTWVVTTLAYISPYLKHPGLQLPRYHTETNNSFP